MHNLLHRQPWDHKLPEGEMMQRATFLLHHPGIPRGSAPKCRDVWLGCELCNFPRNHLQCLGFTSALVCFAGACSRLLFC